MTTLAGSAAKEAPARVLIIDDQESIREALGRTLRRLGFETSDAKDAATALAAIKTNHPDVVFLDLRMPGTDGHAVLRQIQALKEPRPPSVIVMSGQGDMNDVIEVLRAGAVDYLRKPWNLAELMAAVTRGIELRRKAEAPRPADATATSPLTADRKAEAANDLPRANRFVDLPGKLRRGEIVLPATPAVLTRLRELVDSPDSSIDDIAAAVEKDPRMVAEILRMANSAVYVRLGRATNAKAAVSRLGLRHVHNLAQTIFLKGLCDVREGPYKRLLTIVWRRSVARALSMRALCDVLDPAHALNGDTAYMIGLMSDIGASLLLWVASERPPGNLTVDDVRDSGAVLEVVRKSHEQLAAALVASWTSTRSSGSLAPSTTMQRRQSPIRCGGASRSLAITWPRCWCRRRIRRRRVLGVRPWSSAASPSFACPAWCLDVCSIN